MVSLQSQEQCLAHHCTSCLLLLSLSLDKQSTMLHPLSELSTLQICTYQQLICDNSRALPSTHQAASDAFWCVACMLLTIPQVSWLIQEAQDAVKAAEGQKAKALAEAQAEAAQALAKADSKAMATLQDFQARADQLAKEQEQQAKQATKPAQQQVLWHSHKSRLTVFAEDHTRAVIVTGLAPISCCSDSNQQ